VGWKRSVSRDRSLLVAENVTVRRGRASLVVGLDLELSAGEVVHLRGDNGVGKTSVLRVLCGLARPAAGQVRRDADCAFVPEKVALAPHMTAYEWLEAMRRLRGIHRIDWSRHTAASGLGPGALRSPSRSLSKGTLQRVALMEALASESPLLLLDEPFSGLDEPGRAWLTDRLRDAAEAGYCVLFTDHAGRSGDRVAPTHILRIHDRRCRRMAVAVDSRRPRATGRGAVVVQSQSPSGVVSEVAVPSAAVDGLLRSLLDGGHHVIEVRP
jgi:heme exporter protein A